jgi:SAM-dependent methyltransferase
MSAPFDTAAATYDTAFTDTPLARALRARVWERLAALFPPGARVVELACGTGDDARFLAQRGVQVLATDHSEHMLAVARRKCAGLPVEFARLDVRDWGLGNSPGEGVDGVFSNFGGLNSITNYHLLLPPLKSLIRPSGHLLLVVMGRWCAWEILWHLLHGDPATAFRRLRAEGALAHLGSETLTVHYPTTAELRRAFAPSFHLTRIWPLGNFLPPSYLEPLTRRGWFPFRLATRLDRLLPGPLWADHTVYEWRRTA